MLGVVSAVAGVGRIDARPAGMAMSEFEAASETRDMAARERAVTTHCSVLGVTTLVFALIVAALLLGR